jgi:hypothetical protein
VKDRAESQLHTCRRQNEPFPFRATALFVTGVVALGVGPRCALFAVGVDGQPDDVILDMGGHRPGGPTDDVIANVVAFVLGTVGVVCILMSWRDFRDAVFDGAQSVGKDGR